MDNKSLLVGVVVGLLVAIIGLLALRATPTPLGMAPPGLEATAAIERAVIVGPQENVLIFDSNRNCASRTITTVAEPIMIKFGTTTPASATSTAVLSGVRGHLQAASTTVTYDGGLYGCGFWGAYGFNASTSVTVTEFR